MGVLLQRVLAVLSLAGLPAVAAPGLSLAPACAGDGFRGRIDEDGRTILFEACATEEGGTARIWRRDPLRGPIELTRVERDGAGLRLAIGGIDVGEANSDAEVVRMLEVFRTPEFALAGEILWARLRAAGVERQVPAAALAPLAATLPIFELGGRLARGAAVESDPDCLGCCGNGCDGCSGCYTQACYEHDKCIRQAMEDGSWSPQLRCLYLLPAAAASAWECV